ncbi:MAG: acetyl-CoA acetyltransferase [Actinomycetia bacterium]|nr:acetyl-CoA acetyltransferase [Actinomycetes bacterium]
MAEAYIVSAVRTPVGKRGGGLSGVHPAELGAHVLRAAVERAGVDPAAIDDVIMGCVSQVGPQSGDIARTAWLSAGLPESVPGVTIDRQCGSSQQAVHFAAQAVLSGTQDLVMAAGVENMSTIPIGASIYLGVKAGQPMPYGQGWLDRYGDQEISQFRGAQLMAEKWGLKRLDLEEFALASHQRAVAAIDAGYFEGQIAPLADVSVDEGPRRDTSLEKMSGLKPLREGWDITAAVASQISDGAAAVLVASADAVSRYGLTPLARIHTLTVTGSDPVFMLSGPIPATQKALARAGLTIDDIDVVEINEAFAPVVLAWAAETGASPERTNPNGGAIALGHPLGATGAVLMTKLVHELHRTGGRYGLQTMCEGGGQANATIIERV